MEIAPFKVGFGAVFLAPKRRFMVASPCLIGLWVEVYVFVPFVFAWIVGWMGGTDLEGASQREQRVVVMERGEKMYE